MIYEHRDYRAYLKAVLIEKQQKNPAYSLRAMARDIGLKAPHLSALTKGKKGISIQSAYKIAKNLNLDSKQTEYFCNLVQFETATSPEFKESFYQKLRSQNEKFQMSDLSLDLFHVIADWYHIPILEMVGLENFKFTPENIGKRLGISNLQTEVAIERLMRLELLEKDESGKFQKVHNNYLFKSKKSNDALQRFHKQMLVKASESIDTQDPTERYFGTQTFSIDTSQIDEAKQILEEARQKIIALFEKGGKRNETYHLGLHLFRLTKPLEVKTGGKK